MTVKNVEKLEHSLVALTVEVSAEELEAAVAKAYLKMRSKINVPGFRPGKAPRKMIEKLYGTEVFYNDAIDIALPDAYSAALTEKEINAVGYPEISVDKIDATGFTFKATVAVYPEVKLGKYKGLSAPKQEVKVTADDVKQRLTEMAERSARLVSVDRKAKKGDIAVIDYEGFDQGTPFDGGKGANHELELGSGSFVPGFEEQVIGMSAGEEKDINITFPQDYHADLAGKDVVFHVKVNEVKFKEIPALDDDFAKDVSEFDTIKELKDDTKKKITEEREQAAKYAFEDALMEKVAEGIECDIPQVMIDEQANRMLENFKSRLQSQGIPFDQYKKMTGMDDAKFAEEAREPATRQVRLDLALGEIIRAEKLSVSDEEIEAEQKKLAEQYGMELESIKKYLDSETIRAQLLNSKAIAVVTDSAKAAKPEEKKAEEKPAEKKPAAKKPAAKKADDAEKPAEKKPAAKKPAAKKAAAEEEKPAKKPASKKPAAKKAE